MSNVDDLLDPLRFNNLSDFELTDVRSIGGGVFAEKNTLEHLRILDLIVKAYQSVHVPTFGHQIPNTPYAKIFTINSATTTKLLEPGKGEVYTVDVVNVASEESATSFNLGMTYPSDIGVVSLGITRTAEITPLDAELTQLSIDQSIIVTYPQVLTCNTVSSGTVNCSVMIGYTKLQQ
tara:strand:+ start:1364 stop:1897 length:534 start_codon:yes stop_codon:yes gene_type:complete